MSLACLNLFKQTTNDVHLLVLLICFKACHMLYMATFKVVIHNLHSSRPLKHTFTEDSSKHPTAVTATFHYIVAICMIRAAFLNEP